MVESLPASLVFCSPSQSVRSNLLRQSKPVLAWRAVLIFYGVLVIVITLLDYVNGIMVLSYWGIQFALISVGVLVLAFIGWKFPYLSAQRWVLLAFGVGVLTIIPGVLMGLNPPGEFWNQYFSVGLSMAAGSLLGFLFINLIGRLPKE